MPNNAANIIVFIGAGFSKILAALPLKRIWALVTLQNYNIRYK